MATIAAHLSIDALCERYVSSSNGREARHFHTIWLLAKGHSIGEVAEMTSLGRQRIEQLAARYNAEGPESLGDLRRRYGSSATVLKPELLDKLRLRLKEPPDDGGLWTSAKVAAFHARELELEKVAVQRGWEALKACNMSIQLPRPKNPKSASPEEAAAFKRTLKTLSPRKRRDIPSGQQRMAVTASTGFMRPPSSRPRAAKPSGICTTASRNRFCGAAENLRARSEGRRRPHHRARHRQRRLAWRGGSERA